MANFEEKFESMIPSLRKKIFNGIEKEATTHGYKTIWKHFQDIASEIIKGELLSNIDDLKEENIRITSSKSTYPDIEVNYGGDTYAIDIKSNEEEKQPWYDIARLDTIEEKRIAVYKNEYDVVIKYSSSTKEIKAVYIEPMYKTVGLNEECKGVKYRPYDGKLRPKDWEMFEKGEAYWKTKDDFINGIKKSKIHRRIKLIEEWCPEFSKEEILKLVKKFVGLLNEKEKERLLNEISR